MGGRSRGVACSIIISSCAMYRAAMSETGCECSDNLVNSLEVTPVSDSSESEEKTNSQSKQ